MAYFGRRQAIIWTYVGILLIGPFGTNFSEILIHENAFGNAIRKIAVICFGLNVLINNHTRVRSVFGITPYQLQWIYS